MGFDKTKALNAAEKFLSQGKIPAAVQEYRKIVERDPTDFASLNTLGDLHARTKRPDEAIVCFLRVAEHYREQGFALKAIAMYKKIARLDPKAAGVAQHLAQLYEQQGLYVEARAQYTAVADAATQAGRAVESLEAMRRVADLDPTNIDIRTRLAEGYTREGLVAEAADAYAEAGELLLSAGKSKESLDAYRHAHKLAPASHAVLHGLVSASFAAGVAADAARVLEKSIESAPDDLELRAMLARAYVEAEDAAAAERATAALVAAEHTNYPVWFEVARLYLKQSASDDAVRVLARAVELALTGKQERAVLELLDAALALDPKQIEALKLVLRIHTWRRDDEGARVTLERLADAAHERGETEEERRALEHLVRLVPFDQGYHERLSRLGGDSGAANSRSDSPAEFSGNASQTTAAFEHDAGRAERPEAADAFAFAADLSSFDAQAFDASSHGASPFESASRFESAAFESFADVQGPGAFEFAPAHDAEAARADTPSAPPPIDLTTNANGSRFERNSVEGNGRHAAERPVAKSAAKFDPSASFADLNEDVQAGGVAAAPPPAAFDFAIERNGFDEPAPPTSFSAPPPDAPTAQRDQFTAATADPLAAPADPFALATEATPARGEDERVQSLLRQELESVDFYLEQGYADIARDTLHMLERQYGASAETEARRTRLTALAHGEPRAAEPHTFDDRGESFVDLSGIEYSADERAARAAEEFRIDEASLFVAEEASSQSPIQQSPVQQPPVQQSPAQTQQSAERAARAVDSHLASIFGELLDDEPVDAPPSNDADYETHYNLGLAYREMCLWDESVEQFQKAFDLIGQTDAAARRLACCNMLAHCLAQKGMPRAAVIWLKRALALPSLTEDESQALRYDLAAAYEQAGDIDRAIDTFSEVYGVDVSYRGVAERLRELQSMKVVNR